VKFFFGPGKSLACVSLYGPSLYVNQARIYGTLHDGRRHDVRLPTLASPATGAPPPPPEGGDPMVGRELADGTYSQKYLVYCRYIANVLGR
jgi:hypothetical protein